MFWPVNLSWIQKSKSWKKYRFFFSWNLLEKLNTLSLTLWRQWHRWAWLCVVSDTVVIDSAVSVILWGLTLRCQWYCGDWLCGVNDTAELDSALSLILWGLTLLCQSYRWAWLCSVNDIAEFYAHIKISLRTWDNMRKYSSIWIKGPIGSESWNDGKKSSDTVTLIDYAACDWRR